MKLIKLIILFLCLGSWVFATEFLFTDTDYQGNNIINVSNISTNKISITSAPAQCPSNSAVIFWNGSHAICGDDWVNEGGDTMTGNLTIEANLNVTGNITTNDIFLGGAGIEQDQFIYFFEDGSSTGESISWDDGLDRWEFTDTIRSNSQIIAASTSQGSGVFSTSDMWTTGANDDLWLGTATQNNALFRANATGDIQTNHINSNGNFTGNQIYGETNVHPDGNITVIINTQNVHENITGFNVNKTNGFIMDGNDTLIAQVSGRYQADYWLSVSGGVNDIYESCLAVNNEHVEPHAHRKQGTPGDIGSMSGGSIIDINAGDTINLQIRNTDATANVDIFFAGMRLVRVGD